MLCGVLELEFFWNVCFFGDLRWHFVELVRFLELGCSVCVLLILI